MLPKRLELLQGMPIFGALRSDALQVLLRRAQTAEVPAGSFFFLENDPASSMYVLEGGDASVMKVWRGRDYVLNRLGPGDCFGEMALMDLQPRSASVRADSHCHAIEISHDDLLHLYERDIEQFALIQMNIGREVCRRLRATDELLFRTRLGEHPVGPGSFFSPA
ncbi:MAG: cyclic nucleotide-binding domain-containing protein [Rubrivivax sp.]